jgi:hypothetical protein
MYQKYSTINVDSSEHLEFRKEINTLGVKPEISVPKLYTNLSRGLCSFYLYFLLQNNGAICLKPSGDCRF